MPDTKEASMVAVRKRVDDVRTLVYRLSHEIERLRGDSKGATGECRDAYRLVIQDKMRKLENAVVLLSHKVLDHTLYDDAQPTMGELERESREFYGC